MASAVKNGTADDKLIIIFDSTYLFLYAPGDKPVHFLKVC